MGYLERSYGIRIVSIAGQKLAEVMFWWNPEIDQKGPNYDTLFVKFLNYPLGPGATLYTKSND